MEYFVQEWQVLQKQVDDFEKWSLIIKITNVLITLFLIIFIQKSYIVGSIIFIVWLQDGIWKTFQSRSEFRLLSVEKAIEHYKNSEKNAVDLPFQLNSDFLVNRPSTISLIAEYIKQSIRPTVAFPHLALVTLYYFQLFMS